MNIEILIAFIENYENMLLNEVSFDQDDSMKHFGKFKEYIGVKKLRREITKQFENELNKRRD